MSDTVYLVLENGKIFKGKAFGAIKEVVAEIVFTTGMTGYIETLTDKSYYGQAVVQTFPLIGNYGVISDDFESQVIGASAYIVKTWCQEPSNFRNEGNLDTFLKERGITGVYDIDTRALTKLIRESGVMNGKIVYSLDNIDLDEIKNYRIERAVESVSTKKMYLEEVKNNRFKVALLDFGLKQNIVRELQKRGCEVLVCPYNMTAEKILEFDIDGIMLSNGPGDPADNVEVINNLREIIKTKIPMFGICLGHQLLALAMGCSTKKLKYGHRGANQPVKNIRTNRVYISSQNHGYAVQTNSIDESVASQLFVNVNDNTCEGIEYKGYPAFSVQFHPEASAGPQDTSELFDEFVKLMEVNEYAVR